MGAGCAEIDAEEKLGPSVTWAKNTNLGRFTNFVNLLDMAAVAVPSSILRSEPIPRDAPGEKPHPSVLTSTWGRAVIYAYERQQAVPAMPALLKHHVSAGQVRRGSARSTWLQQGTPRQCCPSG